MREHRLSARIAALALGTLALAGLRWHFDLMAEPLASQPVALRLWDMARFFTHLTTFALAVTMLACAWRLALPARLAGGLLVSMLMVAGIHHLFLEKHWPPIDANFLVDQILHTAVPLGMAAWWWAFADKKLDLRNLPWWLAWPLIYGGYVLIRGYATGLWPYDFLNGGLLGPLGLVWNIVKMLLAFAALGLVILWLAQRLRSV